MLEPPQLLLALVIVGVGCGSSSIPKLEGGTAGSGGRDAGAADAPQGGGGSLGSAGAAGSGDDAGSGNAGVDGGTVLDGPSTTDGGDSGIGPDGTACGALAGTCPGAFFDEIGRCFRPAGTCSRSESMGTTRYCWTNGDRFIVSSIGTLTWMSGATACAHGSRVAHPGETDLSVILDTDPRDPLLFYVVETGKGACDRGTPFDGGAFMVPPGLGACPSVASILEPDTSGCTPGVCN